MNHVRYSIEICKKKITGNKVCGTINTERFESVLFINKPKYKNLVIKKAETNKTTQKNTVEK